MRCTHFYLVGVLLSFSIAIAQTHSLSSLSNRIIGGDKVQLGDLPYVASVRLDSIHVCGGTIISDRFILTAAHCLHAKESTTPFDADRISVRVGSTNRYASGKIYFARSILLHDDYKDFRNDIALIGLKETISFNENISMIQFATADEDKPTAGAVIIVAGWGEQGDNTSPYKLHKLTFNVATEEDCANAFMHTDDSIICLDHELKKGSCTGDAGNGGVYNNKLVTVSNFVVGACGSRYPDVFANVIYFSEWIKQKINA